MLLSICEVVQSPVSLKAIESVVSFFIPSALLTYFFYETDIVSSTIIIILRLIYPYNHNMSTCSANVDVVIVDNDDSIMTQITNMVMTKGQK